MRVAKVSMFLGEVKPCTTNSYKCKKEKKRKEKKKKRKKINIEVATTQDLIPKGEGEFLSFNIEVATTQDLISA